MCVLVKTFHQTAIRLIILKIEQLKIFFSLRLWFWLKKTTTTQKKKKKRNTHSHTVEGIEEKNQFNAFVFYCVMNISFFFLCCFKFLIKIQKWLFVLKIVAQRWSNFKVFALKQFQCIHILKTINRRPFIHSSVCCCCRFFLLLFCWF